MSPGLCIFCGERGEVSDSWVDDWLGAARFARYVADADGDRSRALRLYEWNVEAGQALMHDIAHFEVALRNAYDAAISARWRTNTHWLLDAESPAIVPIWRTRNVKGMKRGSDVNALNRKAVDAAIARCGFGSATPGKVIAELTLGFWRQLTTNAMEKTVWVPYLHHAFPKGTQRSYVDHTIESVNTLRNRIAHHEPIATRSGSPDPARVHREMVNILDGIAPAVHSHVSATSRVRHVLTLRP
jgi:hypothetical protein